MRQLSRIILVLMIITVFLVSGRSFDQVYSKDGGVLRTRNNPPQAMMGYEMPIVVDEDEYNVAPFYYNLSSKFTDMETPFNLTYKMSESSGGPFSSSIDNSICTIQANTNGTIQINTKPDGAGQVDVYFNVTDPLGAGVEPPNPVPVVVQNTNDPPGIVDVKLANNSLTILGKSASVSMYQGEWLNLTFYAHDPDGTDTLQFEVESADSSTQFVGMNLFSTKIDNYNYSTVFSYKAKNADVGKLYLNVSVNDGSVKDWVFVTITVLNTNDPPELSPFTLIGVDQYSWMNKTLHATDPDLSLPGSDEVLTFSCNLSDSIQGMTKGSDWDLGASSGEFWINPVDQEIVGIDPQNPDRTYLIRFTVTDKSGMSSSLDVNLTIRNVNDPPEQVYDFEVIIEDGDPSTWEEENLTVTVVAPYIVDIDGDPITYEWDFGDFRPYQRGKEVSYTYSEEGYYNIRLIYSDGFVTQEVTKYVQVIELDLDGDTDDDGLPDEWEEEYFGTLYYDAYDDYDRDGYTNLEEYEMDTDPTYYDGLDDDIVDDDIWWDDDDRFVTDYEEQCPPYKKDDFFDYEVEINDESFEYMLYDLNKYTYKLTVAGSAAVTVDGESIECWELRLKTEISMSLDATEFGSGSAKMESTTDMWVSKDTGALVKYEEEMYSYIDMRISYAGFSETMKEESETTTKHDYTEVPNGWPKKLEVGFAWAVVEKYDEEVTERSRSSEGGGSLGDWEEYTYDYSSEETSYYEVLEKLNVTVPAGTFEVYKVATVDYWGDIEELNYYTKDGMLVKNEVISWDEEVSTAMNLKAYKFMDDQVGGEEEDEGLSTPVFVAIVASSIIAVVVILVIFAIIFVVLMKKSAKKKKEKAAKEERQPAPGSAPQEGEYWGPEKPQEQEEYPPPPQGAQTRVGGDDGFYQGQYGYKQEEPRGDYYGPPDGQQPPQDDYYQDQRSPAPPLGHHGPPPPGYYDQGPPPQGDYYGPDQQGPPPGYYEGPPPGYDQPPPPQQQFDSGGMDPYDQPPVEDQYPAPPSPEDDQI
jgi:hypothetical protein